MYRYSYITAHAYDKANQRVSFSGNGRSEDFLRDGLTLIHRGETSFINEPYVTGGNPVEMTSFGETADKNAYTYNLIQKFNTTRIQDNLIYETIKTLAIDKDGNSTYDFPDNLVLNCYSIIAIPLNDHSSEVVAAEINPPLVAFYANLTWSYNAIRLDMSLVKKGLQE
ncbi:MAG: hypothetical protein IKA22_12700 [Lentisphaeria bacterium]|nr:hypothetical protein [Lentisphaeria bacterium]